MCFHNDVIERYPRYFRRETDEDVVNIVEGPRRQRVFRNRLEHFILWNDSEFKCRFRVSKESVGLLMEHIGSNLQRPTNRSAVPTYFF